VIPATTAVECREQPAPRAQDVQGLERVHDEAVVGEDRLPRERPDQVGDEERRHDEQQQQVLPPAAAECDPVGHRVAQDEREQRRDPGVFQGADELRPVVVQRRPVVPPRPGEREPDIEVTGLQRLVRQEAEGHDEERRQEQRPRSEQHVRGQPAVTVEQVHAETPISRRSGSATGSGTSGCSARRCRRCGPSRACPRSGRSAGFWRRTGCPSAPTPSPRSRAGCSRRR